MARFRFTVEFDAETPAEARKVKARLGRVDAADNLVFGKTERVKPGKTERVKTAKTEER